MDLALAMVEEDQGPEVSRAVARMLVMFVQRPVGQVQFSTQLAAQRLTRKPLRDVQAWVTDHLADDLTVRVLAERAGMSERNFTRVVRAETGLAPAAYVETVRVEAAGLYWRRRAPPLTRSPESAASASQRPRTAASYAPWASHRASIATTFPVRDEGAPGPGRRGEKPECHRHVSLGALGYSADAGHPRAGAAGTERLIYTLCVYTSSRVRGIGLWSTISPSLTRTPTCSWDGTSTAGPGTNSTWSARSGSATRYTTTSVLSSRAHCTLPPVPRPRTPLIGAVSMNHTTPAEFSPPRNATAGGHPWDCKSKAAEHAPRRSSAYVPEAGAAGRGPTVWFGILSPRQARVAAGDDETLKIAYKQRVRHPRLPDRGGAAATRRAAVSGTRARRASGGACR
ncbi:AraC family transcriptional regulator [Streptomyces inhibens]|uniref:AraC family transcriptional regulator n=1 Tax=Streptomyces inhibens TaxID=2293571 RepID=UPI00368E848B